MSGEFANLDRITRSLCNGFSHFSNVYNIVKLPTKDSRVDCVASLYRNFALHRIVPCLHTHSNIIRFWCFYNYDSKKKEENLCALPTFRIRSNIISSKFMDFKLFGIFGDYFFSCFENSPRLSSFVFTDQLNLNQTKKFFIFRWYICFCLDFWTLLFIFWQQSIIFISDDFLFFTPWVKFPFLL